MGGVRCGVGRVRLCGESGGGVWWEGWRDVEGVEECSGRVEV